MRRTTSAVTQRIVPIRAGSVFFSARVPELRNSGSRPRPPARRLRWPYGSPAGRSFPGKPKQGGRGFKDRLVRFIRAPARE